jgi:hypothetical protein
MAVFREGAPPCRLDRLMTAHAKIASIIVAARGRICPDCIAHRAGVGPGDVIAFLEAAERQIEYYVGLRPL